MSHVMCHMSRVTCHMSKNYFFEIFFCFFLFFLRTKKLVKVVELVGGGSVINGATQSSFFKHMIGIKVTLVLLNTEHILTLF